MDHLKPSGHQPLELLSRHQRDAAPMYPIVHRRLVNASSGPKSMSISSGERHRRLSSRLESPWWVRVAESGDGTSGAIPETRRAHSSTVYRTAQDDSTSSAGAPTSTINETGHLDQANETGHRELGHLQIAHNLVTSPPRKVSERDDGWESSTVVQEYMVISGGFTDDDWTTFPVWFFDMTSSALKGAGTWIELTPPGSDHDEEEECKNEMASGANQVEGSENLWEAAMHCPPQSRVGHISVTHSGYLYVFGGLLYDKKEGVFYEEERPFVYRLKIEGKLPGDSPEVDSQMGDATFKGWERILPRVYTGPSLPDDGPSYDALKRGEIQGGLWKSEGKIVIYGGLQVRNIASTSLNRVQQIDIPLGDVWSYDLATNTWEMMAPSSPPKGGGWNHPTELWPNKRTAHAATVVKDELIVYGGMAKIGTSWDGTTEWETLDDLWVFNLRKKEWKPRLVYPLLARSYHSLVGWESKDGGGSTVASFGGYTTIQDPVGEETIAFVFDDTLISHPSLNNTTDLPVREWVEATDPGTFGEGISHRFEHSAVLSETGEMFVWGGRFQQTKDISGMWMLNVAGENSQVTFTTAEPDGLEEYEAEVAAMHMLLAMVMFMTMMLTAMCGIISRYQAMLEGENGGDDATALADENGDVPTVLSGGRRRRGLRQDIIDSLPLKTYQSGSNSPVSARSDVRRTFGDTSGENITSAEPPEGNARSESGSQLRVIGSDSDSANNGDSDDPSAESTHDSLVFDEEDCCPICLVEYEVGDEIRTLPCKHEFHKTCVDPWLGNNASCPACRHSLRDLASNRPASSLGSQGSIFLRRSLLVRFFAAHTDGIRRASPRGSSNQTGRATGNDPTIGDATFDENTSFEELDLPYVSSLELTEEVPGIDRSDIDLPDGGQEEPSRSQPHSNQRLRALRRVHSLRRGRRGRRRGFRAGSRMVPLNDPLEPQVEADFV